PAAGRARARGSARCPPRSVSESPRRTGLDRVDRRTRAGCARPGIVVDERHHLEGGPRRLTGGVAAARRQAEHEGRALAQLGLDPDVAAHEADELARQRQAEAAALLLLARVAGADLS